MLGERHRPVRRSIPLGQTSEWISIANTAQPRSKTVFLHIGPPKTVTSHIRTVLHDRRDLLRRNGISDPKAGQNALFRDHGHHLLAAALIEERAHELLLRVTSTKIRAAWAEVRDAIEATNSAAFIISSEWFALEIFSRDHFSRLKEALSGLNVVIVVVLRDIVDFVESVYSQRVRDGYAGTVSDFIEDAWYSLNWTDLTNRWAHHFGSDRIVALDFDAMRKGGIVPSFLRQVFGRPIDLGPIPRALTNASLPRTAIEMMREVNGSDIDDDLRIQFRNEVKDFFERSSAHFVGGRYISQEGARMLKLHCKWPQVLRADPA